MKRKKMYAIALWVLLSVLGHARAQSDVADIPSEECQADGDANKTYFLIGDPAPQAPRQGYGLVIIMPGGDGSADFHAFVRRIYKHAVPKGYLAAQPVAVKWTPQQRIVWPTKTDRVKDSKFKTEAFVEAVIKDVQAKVSINPQRIFSLTWSSSGPAGYAISLEPTSSVTGSYIAMSVFKVRSTRALVNARGHAYFIDHSPDDRVCPISMAKRAQTVLSAQGARVKFNEYPGGHGWQGNLYARLRQGFAWLEKNAQVKDRTEVQAPSAPLASELPLEDSFEGRDTWTRGQRVKGVRYVWDSRQAKSGRKSLCLKKTVDAYWPIAQWSRRIVHDETAKTVQVSAQVKTIKAGKAVIDIQFESHGDVTGHQWAVYIGAKEPSDPPAFHDWREYAGEVNIPEGTTGLIVALQIYGPGAVWFDDLTVKAKKTE